MHTSSPFTVGYLLACLPLALAASGCGNGEGSTGSVSGSVNFQGQPVTSGTVVFENGESGRFYSAPLSEQGTYELRGLEYLEYVVSVVPPEEIPTGENAPTFDGTQPMKQTKGADPKNIPELYRSTHTSPLRHAVASPSSELPIELAP